MHIFVLQTLLKCILGMNVVYLKSCCRVHVDGAVDLLSERNNVPE